MSSGKRPSASARDTDRPPGRPPASSSDQVVLQAAGGERRAAGGSRRAAVPCRHGGEGDPGRRWLDDGVGDYVYLIVTLAVVAVLVLAGLVGAGVRRSRARFGRGAGTDTLAPERPTEVEEPEDRPSGGSGATALRDAPPEMLRPTIERPEGVASRLVRLRQRLSRS